MRRETVLLVALVVAFVTAVPANAAGPGPAAAIASFWEHVTAALGRVWAGGDSGRLKACESGPTIDPNGCPRSASSGSVCEQGATIDPSGCPQAAIEVPTCDHGPTIDPQGCPVSRISRGLERANGTRAVDRNR